MTDPALAIVDLGLGNLFSVARACEHAGLRPSLASDAAALESADALLLPGVGAFAAAMEELHTRDLASPLRDAVAAGKPLIGICLGLQLLASESTEFGRHRGLGLIEGRVVRLDPGTAREKVPLVGWRPIVRAADWSGAPLSRVREGAYMYFVHSYHFEPRAEDVVLSETAFGSGSFCSALSHANVFACQFHPERSGPDGLALYAGIRNWLSERPFEARA